MARSEAGFTLIELTLVLAIAGGLIVIALAGQRQLRSQASFSADVDKVIASIADARNQAMSGVNTVGAGNGATPAACLDNSGASYSLAGQAQFAGVLWGSVTPTGGFNASPITRRVYVNNGGAACYDSSQTATVGVATPITILGALSTDAPPIPKQPQILFVRHDSGLGVCMIKVPADPSTFFANPNSCPVGSSTTFNLMLTDQDGHTKSITVDGATGFAHR